MKKWKFTIIFLCLLAFSLSAIRSNNPMIAVHPNSAIKTALTQSIEHTYNMTYFNQTNAQYLNTVGNDTLSLNISQTTDNYKGLYSFTNESDGANPAGWTITETGDADVQILNNLSGHSKVVRLFGAFNCQYATMKNTFASQTEGTIELWVRATDGYGGTIKDDADNIEIELQHGASQATYIWFDYGQGHAEAYNTGYIALGGVKEEVWYHLRIDFWCSTDTFNVYINGTLVGNNIAFMNAQTDIDNLYINAVGDMNQGNSTFYIDAVDYSFASDYYLNRNLDREVLYEQGGSYVTPPLDLGLANNYFIQYINMSINLPIEASIDLAGHTKFSTDNNTWTGWILLCGLQDTDSWNITVGGECSRYMQFYFNLSSSSDQLITPELYSLSIQFEETIQNQVPYFQDIAPANNSLNLGLLVPINCSILDDDSDLLNVSLYINNSLVTSATNIESGSLFYYLLNTSWNTWYAFYFNATDSENTTISDTYFFQTTSAPLTPPSATPDFVPLYFLFGFVGIGLIALALAPSKHK